MTVAIVKHHSFLVPQWVNSAISSFEFLYFSCSLFQLKFSVSLTENLWNNSSQCSNFDHKGVDWAKVAWRTLEQVNLTA